MQLTTNNKLKLFIPVIGMLMLMVGCASQDQGWSDKRLTVMSTSTEIRVFHQDRQQGHDAINEAFERMLEIEAAFAVQHINSQISRINASANASPTSVTDEVRFLLEEGLRHYELSGGLYHIGLGNLVNLWGFSSDQFRVPNNDAISATLEAAEIESVQLRGNQVMLLERGVSLNLDEPAKGYALDEAARALRDLGITSGLITLGDDVYALGEKPGGDSWHIWIKEPFATKHQPIGYMEVINLAVTTTGNDVPSPFTGDEAAYYHQVIDPRTGRLVSNQLASVIVVSDTGLDGSVYSTTAFIMGLDDGYRYLMAAPGLEGLFITKDNVIYITPGLTGMFHLVDEENYAIEVMVIDDENELDS